jgi:hypothetical protein
MDLPIGTTVVDADDAPADRDRVLVVNTPSATAGDWHAYTDRNRQEVTVADSNPDYSTDAPITTVVFAPEWEENVGDHRPNEPVPLTDLAVENVRCCTLPIGRLDVVDDGRDGNTVEATEHHAEFLRSANFDDVRITDEGAVIGETLANE